MNKKMIGKLVGVLFFLEALFMLPAIAVCFVYGETGAPLRGFLWTVALLLALSGALYGVCAKATREFYAKEGFIIVALGWILLSAMGALPFYIFETVSGFTTTGASVLTDVEAMSHGLLYWRSFTHWLGGMGMLVFLLAVVPTGKGAGYSIHLLRAESPGPSVGKMVPRMRQTASLLYKIYIVLTVLCVLFLLAGGMPLFDSLCTAFGTAGTGGFGFRNDSFGSFSPYIQWVVTVFMILFGVNFNAYFLLLMRKFRRAAASEEVRGYFVVIVVAVGIITANIYSMYNSFGEALRQAAFQVGSIITTTGFSSCDFDLWPTLSKEVLVVLMFIGACAGSTGGGIKVSRILILGKTLGKELKQALHPQVVAPARMDGKLLNHETIRTTNVFMAAYSFIFVGSFLLISLNGFDMVTNFTAVAATLNNIGPGLELVGPMQNFGGFADPAKLVLIFDMLAGRLEIFPMLVLFLPDTWRKF
mgnify:CR=1 FL=1